MSAPNPRGVSNAPFFVPGAPARPMQEVWYMRLNAPDAARALWLRFTLLLQPEGGKRVAEVWAIEFKKEDAEWRKLGWKNTFSANTFAVSDDDSPGFHVEHCAFSDTRTCGALKSDAHAIAWDFSMREGVHAAFDFVPLALRRIGLVRNEAVNVFEDLRFTGWSEVDGERFVWTDAPGMQGHLWGERNGHSWAWGQCNCFVDENGAPVTLIWDGLTARARRGKNRASPALSTMYVFAEGRHFCLNRVRDIFAIRSDYGEHGWDFRASGNGIALEGKLRAQRDHFAGVTYEDTDGSNLYCYNSKVSDLELTLRIESGWLKRLFATGTAAYEFVVRSPHPEIPLVI